MNNEKLKEIVKLEDLGLFEEAFIAYNSIFLPEEPNFEIWRYYYFFLWTSYEDASSEFFERIEAEKRLQDLIKIGVMNFSEIAEFNFIAGYTICIFPYIYGEYEEWEEKAAQMLKKAFLKEPKNPIYEMIYLGSGQEINPDRYNQCRKEAQPKVLDQFSGIGYLNNYFRQILLDKK
jgi:hypothetical protein